MNFQQPIFITGIGTGVGKTLVSAIVAEALGAYYWKPVQAGFEEGTDAEWVAARIGGTGIVAGDDGAGGRIGPVAGPGEGHAGSSDDGAGRRIGPLAGPGRVIPEAYRLRLPASPHIAAREEGVVIGLDGLAAQLPAVRPLVVEGAGGLYVPLNDTAFMADLILRLDATVILVSRNYLGSINHSLLTAEACRIRGIRVAGWVFNDQYGHYEEEIVRWSGLPALGSVPFREAPDAEFVRERAQRMRARLLEGLAAVEPGGTIA